MLLLCRNTIYLHILTLHPATSLYLLINSGSYFCRFFLMLYTYDRSLFYRCHHFSLFNKWNSVCSFPVSWLFSNFLQLLKVKIGYFHLYNLSVYIEHLVPLKSLDIHSEIPYLNFNSLLSMLLHSIQL